MLVACLFEGIRCARRRVLSINVPKKRLAWKIILACFSSRILQLTNDGPFASALCCGVRNVPDMFCFFGGPFINSHGTFGYLFGYVMFRQSCVLVRFFRLSWTFLFHTDNTAYGSWHVKENGRRRRESLEGSGGKLHQKVLKFRSPEIPFPEISGQMMIFEGHTSPYLKFPKRSSIYFGLVWIAGICPP